MYFICLPTIYVIYLIKYLNKTKQIIPYTKYLKSRQIHFKKKNLLIIVLKKQKPLISNEIY